ncbi:MAG: hypothetical protein WA728_03395, partial [Xanthobacteraceae bacterium]
TSPRPERRRRNGHQYHGPIHKQWASQTSADTAFEPVSRLRIIETRRIAANLAKLPELFAKATVSGGLTFDKLR